MWQNKSNTNCHENYNVYKSPVFRFLDNETNMRYTTIQWQHLGNMQKLNVYKQNKTKKQMKLLYTKYTNWYYNFHY